MKYSAQLNLALHVIYWEFCIEDLAKSIIGMKSLDIKQSLE